MALVNKNSIFDRIPAGNSSTDDKHIGKNIEGAQFDLGPGSTLQQDSLGSVDLDLDGQPDSMYNRMGGDPGFTIFPERGLPKVSDSPFNSPTGDHMVDLLDKLKIISENTGEIYRGTPAHGQGFDLNGLPGPSFDKGIESTLQQNSFQSSNLDLEGVDNGQGLFDKGPDSTMQEDLLISEDSDLHYMDGLQPPTFDLGKDSTLQPDSLANVPGGSQSSPYQDLDGKPGEFFHEINKPTKGQGLKIKGEDLHVHLLTKGYTYGHGPGTFTTVLGENERGHEGGALDSDGTKDEQGLFTKGRSSNFHVRLLEDKYKYSPTGLAPGSTTAGPGELDLNGNIAGNGFFNGVGNGGQFAGFQIKNKDLHEHMLTNGYGTRTVHNSANSFGFIKESRAAGGLDLDGGNPSYGTYLNNKPEPGSRF